MSHSLRRRWTTSLAVLATLLSTAAGVELAAAAPASAQSTAAWQATDMTGSQTLRGYFDQWNCYYYTYSYCQTQDGLSQLFTASTTGGVSSVLLSTPWASSPTGTIEIRSAENYPDDGATVVAHTVSSAVSQHPNESGAMTRFHLSGESLTAGTQYELVFRTSGNNVTVGTSDADGSTPTMNVHQVSHYCYAYYSLYCYQNGASWNDQGRILAATVLESDGSDAPTVSVTVSPSSPDGTNGWYKTHPTVHFLCDDDLMVTDCPADQTIADGTYDVQTGTVHDGNGNSATYSIPALKVDTTPPAVSIGVDNTAAATAGTYSASTGWYLGTPDFTGSCEDGATCTVGYYSPAQYGSMYCATYGGGTYYYYCGSPITGGYGHWMRTATDAAGNLAIAVTAEGSFNPGTPTITGSVSGLNAAGWSNGGVHNGWDYNTWTYRYDLPNTFVSWSCSSQYASVSMCGGSGGTTGVTTETTAAGSDFSGTVTDSSGKTATASVTVKVDKTPPTVSPVIAGTVGQNGWYTSPVTVSWTCDDALSGVKACSTSSNTFTDQQGTASGTGTDVADNTANASVSVMSDTIAPAITGTVVTDKGYGGVYDEPITVHWTCSDPGSGNGVSGVGTCPADTTVTGIGSDTVASATVLDNAGNATVGAVSHLFRRVDAPAITVTGALNGKTYAFGTTVTPSCTAVSGSGDPVDCTGTVEGGNPDGSGLYVYTATASDPITHLSSTRTVQWIVADRPAVSLVIGDVRDEGTYAYGTKVKPTCSATDADGHTVSCTGVVSGGNTDGSGLFTYKALATDSVTGKVSAARVSWTVGSKPAPSVAIAGVVSGHVYAYGTKVTPSCVAADADGASLTCDGITSHSKVAGGVTAYLFKATVTDPATGLMSSASASWTVAAAGKAAISGLPTKTKAGHPVLVAGKDYTVTASFTGSTESDPASAPMWLKPVRTNAAGTSGTPSTVIGGFQPAEGGTYVWEFTPSKAMKGTFRKFGVRTPDGKVTYQTVYVK